MWKRPPLVALMIGCLGMPPVAAAPTQIWSLWIVQPERPGHLESCSSLKTAAAPPAQFSDGRIALRLDQALTIRWQGGYLVQAVGQGDLGPQKSDGWNAYDSCFVLTVRDSVIAAGALVRRESARLLRFDTLLLLDQKAGQPLSFALLPNFPGEIEQPAAPYWRHALAPLSATTAMMPR